MVIRTTLYLTFSLQGLELPVPEFNPSSGTLPCYKLPDLASITGESPEHMPALSRRVLGNVFTATQPIGYKIVVLQ